MTNGLFVLVCVSSILSAEPAPSAQSPPATRMGDPWGMIYGGSGFGIGDMEPEAMIRAYAERAATYRKWGVGSARMGICWCNVEKERGTYDWFEPDAKLKSVADAGINVVLCVATTPKWAWQRPEAEAIFKKRGQSNLAGCLPHKPEYWPDYERYLAEVVKRYKSHLKHYELWNEPDGMAGFRFHTDDKGNLLDVWYGGDPEWYAELVKRSYTVIKRVDPEARVCIGSFERKDPAKPESQYFFRELYEHGIKGHFDAVSIHPYGDAAPNGQPFARGWLKVCRDIMVEHGDGDKPMWITEYSLDKRGIAMAFETRRKLRLLRETPWISVAQPLIFELHFDEKASPFKHSLRAHKQMAEEFAPRESFTADFEGSLMRLFANWEWNVTGFAPADVQQAELRSEYPHEGQRCLFAETMAKMVRVWFTPYVRGDDLVFRGHLLVEPKERDTLLLLSVGIESGDILQDVREVRPLRTGVPANQWFPFEFSIAEHFPEWKDLSVVTCYVEIQSDKPGLKVSVDDVYVGPRE